MYRLYGNSHMWVYTANTSQVVTSVLNYDELCISYSHINQSSRFGDSLIQVDLYQNMHVTVIIKRHGISMYR